MTVDQYIQIKFNFTNRRRNLPFYPRRGTRDDLPHLFWELEYSNGVEVGTLFGDFAEALCTANPKLHLTCVDPYMAYMGRTQAIEDAIYEKTAARLAPFNVTMLRKPSLEATASFPNRSLDFVYIDANHSFDFIIQDMIHWAAKVKRQGILAMHDYDSTQGADVFSAINAYTHAHHIDPWYVTRELTPTAFWVCR
jgi:hypothetical protein